MDAQDAVGSDKTKPAASPTRPTTQPDDKASVNVVPKATEGAIQPSRSPTGDSKPILNPTRPTDPDDDAVSGDRDSDAETIVLPGKDGHSPSKVRKVKHEDGSDAEVQRGRKRSDGGSNRDGDAEQRGPGSVSDAASALSQHKKKPRVDRDMLRPDKPSRGQDGSSGLSSAPTSPPHHRRRTGAVAHDSESDADRRKRSPKLSMKDRAKSTDQLGSHKRKASRVGSDDDPEERKAARRRRIEDRDRTDWLAPKEGAKGQHRDPKSAPSRWRNDSQCRSVSPPARTHRRSISSQLPSQNPNGLSQKKRRLPPPLRSTEYHSDESSASGSPHPRSSKMRNLSTPATADLNMSPAKMTQSKKHVDAHGQTALARACNKGEYDIAKQRLAERPGDLNVADYAGNTPLQSASINGFEDIVKLLIEAGCDVNCMNSVKDTPLLDAVDNGHLEVVKLLLAAGVNPRKANLEGEEPLDRISDDLDNAEEIRAALVEAKQKSSDLRRTSEEHHHTDHADHVSHGPDSPRRSPAPTNRRPVNSRATKIGNHHLYVNLDEKTLRAAAAKGDEETVTRVLQVKERYDDPEAMVAAARGGHSVVMELLLALGGANPDPAPVLSLPSEFATPMLAAIGQENIDVLKLLLSQANFDPTRKYRGAHYYQIAQQRQGTNWKEEEEILKNAFDAYKKSPRDAKTRSPGKRDRERGQDSKRPGRNLVKEESRPQRRNLSSPTRETELRRKSASSRAVTSPKEKRRSDSFTHQDEQTSPRRGPAKSKKDDRVSTVTASDREASPATSQKLSTKPKRIESDMAAFSSEGETVKPRRKLVSKGELRGERDKQRRTSMVSSTSSVKDPASPRDTRTDEAVERPKPELLTEKYHDRTKALKRDESRERPSGSSDPPAKRHRSSVTPPHSNKTDKDGAEGPTKRRRLDTEGKERRQRTAESPDDRPRQGQDGPAKPKAVPRESNDEGRKTTSKSNTDGETHRKDHARLSDSDKSSIHVKSEDVDVDMHDAPPAKQSEKASKEPDDEKRRRDTEAETKEARRKEERQKEADKKRRDEREAQEREAEKKRLAEDEEAKHRLEEEKRRKAKEEKRRQLEDEKIRKAEEDKKRAEALAEEERLKREAEAKEAEAKEAEAKEAEERRRREEAEAQRLREETERKRIEDEKRKRKEEEEQRQREEEERLRREQLEREAAEQARREKEEEARKAREDQERREREERDRFEREAREAELRQAREEQERQRRVLELPPLLRWLDQCIDPFTSEVATRFKHLQGLRYDTIRPETVGTPDGREQWVFNFQVALVLGEKDLSLAKYPTWERVLVSDLAKPDLVKRAFWRLEADQYALTSYKNRDLGAELPNYYGEGQDASAVGSPVLEDLRRHAQAKFLNMDMFLVKLSDLLGLIPTINHLQNIRLSVEYREIPEDEAQELAFQTPRRYRQDPGAERFMGFAPRSAYYVNGQKVGEDLPGLSATSKVPFPDHERRVPRRNGLQQVFPGEPDYAKLCLAQGLGHLVNGHKSPSPSLPNGVHPSPISQTTDIDSVSDTNTALPTVASSATVPSDDRPQLVNGTNGIQEANPL